MSRRTKFLSGAVAGYLLAVLLAGSAAAQVPDVILRHFDNTLRQLQQNQNVPPGMRGRTQPGSNERPNISSTKPTIDCLNVQTPLGRILCSDSNAARADWDVNASAWAYAGTLEDAARKAFWQHHDGWVQSVISHCALSHAVSDAQRRCVVTTYRARAQALRSKLNGDALAETNLSPQQRADIQARLVALGFLNDKPDGEFGPNTRAAIRKFQLANGFQEGAYLTEQQRQAFQPRAQILSHAQDASQRGQSREPRFAEKPLQGQSLAQRFSPEHNVGLGGLQARPFATSKLLPVKVSAFDKKFNEIAARTAAYVRAVSNGCGEMVGLPKGLRQCNYSLGNHSIVSVVGPTDEGDALGIDIRSDATTAQAQAQTADSVVIITELVAPERSAAAREHVVQELLREIERVKLTPPTLVCQDLGGRWIKDGETGGWVLSGSDYNGEITVRIVRPLSGNCPRGVRHAKELPARADLTASCPSALTTSQVQNMAREFAKDLDRPENSQLLRLANDAAFAFAKRALRAQIENYLGKDGATEAAIKALDDLTESQMVLCFPELDAAWRNLQNRANAIQQEQERRKADAKRPVNVLGNAYSAYILLRRCHEAREGYAVIYISDAELERSRQAIKRIEKALKPQLGPSDDINRTWNRANDYADQRPITLELCQSSYTWLMQQYKAITPQENYLEKDF